MSQSFQGLFQRVDSRCRPQTLRRVAGKQAALIQNRNQIGQLFDLRQSVRGKQYRCAVLADDALQQEAPKFRGRERIEAARGFIEKQYGRPVQHGPRQTQPVNVSCRKRAHLAVQKRAQVKQFGEFSDPSGGIFARQIIESGKQIEVLSRAQAGVEAAIGAGVVPDLQSDFCGLAGDVESANLRVPARRKQQGGEDAQERGFPRTIRADQSEDLALPDVEGNST